MLPGEEALLTSTKKFVEESDLSIKSEIRTKVICPIFLSMWGV